MSNSVKFILLSQLLFVIVCNISFVKCTHKQNPVVHLPQNPPPEDTDVDSDNEKIPVQPVVNTHLKV